MGENIDLADLLRRVEILEQAVLGPAKGKKPKASAPSNAETFDGATGGVRFLISKGFFNSRRTFAEVEKAMQDNGYHYSKQAVQMPLGRLSTVGAPLVALKSKGKNVYVKENSARALVEEAQALLQQALRLLGSGERASPKKAPTVRAAVASPALDFDTPFRAFVKRHAAGMSGARKFTLLVAYIAKGDVKKSVDLAEIKQHWNKVKAKGLLGMTFNPNYTSDAKEHDWVDASAGAYVLRPGWKGIFE